MRILRLIPYFSDNFGGPVLAAKRLTRQLEELGHETVFYTSDLADKAGNKMRTCDDDFQVHAFPVKWSVGDFFYTPAMKGALRQEDFDIIHAHCYRNYQSELAAWLARRTGKPLVFTAHGTLVKLPFVREKIVKGGYDLLLRMNVLRQSSRVVALSSFEMNQYRSAGVPANRIVKIYHGVDVALFRSSADSDSAKKELGFGPEVILYAGRIHQRKGLQYLVSAFRHLEAEFPQAMLVICGPDYGYKSQIVELVNEHSLDGRVVFLDAQRHETMPRVYAASDIVVLPAHSEVFGNVLAEAAACGKPIIATRWGWAGEFFEDREDCVLLDRFGDVEALVNALRILLLNPAMRQKLGENARQKVLRNLSWEHCASAHSSLYEQLVFGSVRSNTYAT